VIPLRDANPTRRRAVVTLGLIVACFVVFVGELWVQATGGDAALDRLVIERGAVPVDIADALGAGHIFSMATLGLLTSLFLHGGWLHILGNMLYLWIFGNNVEDRLGRIPFLVFYLLGGLVAGLSQVAADPHSSAPLVGASGAIAATLGVYLVLYPGARIESIVFLGFFFQIMRVPAVLLLGFWFVLQLVDGVASLGATATSGGVAVFAHIGGFVLGLAVGLVIRWGSGGRSDRRSGGRAGTEARFGQVG
jgi:membrane associated rhomboid family serine protease